MDELPTPRNHPVRRWLDRVLDGLDRAPTFVFAAVPLSFLVLLIVGLVRWYSPVPFWDMWDAYLAAYIQYLDGDWRALFVQTNEHRIWFSNILFYLDLRFFGGRSLLLIPANVVLALFLWLAFSVIARELLKDASRLWPPLALGMGILCLSWLQEQNLAWGFQSQFFVAYLFPLISFACLGMSQTSARSGAWFGASLFFGLFSLGTMANGIAVLPLLFVMSVVMPRVSWRRTFLIALIGVAAIAAWFQGYFTVTREQASLTQAVTFVLTFFGLPIGEMLDSKVASYVAGALFIVATATFALMWLRSRKTASPLVLALVVFLIYVGASCAVIALGRAAIQPNAALVSRYATPSLTAWCALAVLFVYRFRHLPFARVATLTLSVLVAAGLSPAQKQVFGDAGPELVHQRHVGALALKMRVADRVAIGVLYPTGTDEQFDHVRTVASFAEAKGLSIMGDPDLKVASVQLGKPIGAPLHICSGVVGPSEAIDGEPNYVRMSGWVFDEQPRKVPPYAYLVVNGVVEGVGVTGHIRRDVASAFGETAVRSGFSGFLRSRAVQSPIQIYCIGEL